MPPKSGCDSYKFYKGLTPLSTKMSPLLGLLERIGFRCNLNNSGGLKKNNPSRNKCG
mgnify:CR=1 FL=1